MQTLADEIEKLEGEHALEILNVREKTHGSFQTNAERAQHLKWLFREWGYDYFCPVHREALDMIALKLSRIFSGQQNFRDHWDDGAGYFGLGAEACDDPKRKALTGAAVTIHLSDKAPSAA